MRNKEEIRFNLKLRYTRILGATPKTLEELTTLVDSLVNETMDEFWPELEDSWVLADLNDEV